MSMTLSDLKTEVFAHGFDSTQFGAARITKYLNDAQADIARRVNYFTDEATQTIATSAGTSLYAQPTDLARYRELVDTDLSRPLQAVPLKYIDSSFPTTGTPTVYALDGAYLHLFPTPDGVHNLLLRYWKMPVDLVNDGDVPALPSDFHDLLWFYAVGMAFKAEDDLQQGQSWMNDYNTGLAQAAAALKYVNSDMPTQAKSMFDQTLGRQRGWSLTGFGW